MHTFQINTAIHFFFFLSNFDFFYMFRTSTFRPQEDCCKSSFCMVSSLAGGRVCSILINYALRNYASMKLCNIIDHTLSPARLLTPMHVNLSYKNYIYNSFREDEPMRFETCSKAIPLQARRGPEGSRRLRLRGFKTIGTRRW